MKETNKLTLGKERCAKRENSFDILKILTFALINYQFYIIISNAKPNDRMQMFLDLFMASWHPLVLDINIL